MRNARKGFTLVELIICFMLVDVVFIGIAYCLVGRTIICGNFYISETKALKVISASEPEFNEVVLLKRGAWSYAEATAKAENGFQKVFYLDTDILQNCELRDSQDD